MTRTPQGGRRARPSQSGPRLRPAAFAAYLAVSGLLVAGATFGVAAPALAQSAKSYAIPAGPLGAALTRFAGDAGVVLSFDPAALAGKTTQGLNGSYAPEDGMNALLRGSGYRVGKTAAGYALVAAPGSDARETTLKEVTVTAAADPGALAPAYAGGQIARGGRLGLLGNVDVMNAPFHVTSFTAKAIADQQAGSVAEMIDKDPSVRSTAPGGDVADAFFIRGFALGDNNIGEIAFDGLYGVGPNYRLMTDYAERIEVLKGPSAMIYGMSPNSGVGGSINVVPKRADADLTRVRADYTGSAQVGGAVDVARRFGAAREFGVRFNGSHQDGDTAVDHQSRKATLGTLALDYQGERLRASLDLIQQRDDVDAPTRRPFLGATLAVPEAPDNRRNTTQRWEWYESTERSALLRAEYDLHPQLTVFASHGAATSDVERLFNTPSITSAAGDTTTTPAHAIFDVRRDSSEAGVRARFASGAVKHQLTLQWSRYDDHYRMGSATNGAYTSNIYQPIERAAINVGAPASVPLRSETSLGGAAVSDTLSMLDERLQIMAGLRKQRVDTTNYSPAGAVTGRYNESAVTPMLGVVFKPLAHVSVYGNYIEGLSKGDTAPETASNKFTSLAPYKARQKEIGVKVDHGKLMTTLAAFEITRPSAFQNSDKLYVADGRQRNRGVELSAYGEAASGLRLHGGVTWIDAKLVKTSSAATTGKSAVGVPDLQLSLNAEWDVPQVAGLTLTGGLLHSEAQYANQLNTQRLPAWTTFDLGARYPMVVGGKRVTLRALVRNASNESYWSGASTWGTLMQGAPRTLRVSATVDF